MNNEPEDRTKKLDNLNFFPDANTKRHIQYGQTSDVGRQRENNEDRLFSILATPSLEAPDFGVFIVADGMGGQVGGERASMTASNVIMQAIASQMVIPLIDPNSERPIVVDMLRDAFEMANRAVVREVPGGGTTATVATVMGNLAYFAHVGDSRAYVIENGKIEQITRDHSLAQKLVEIGQLDPKEAATNRRLTQLYHALGQDEPVDPDILTRRLAPNARIVLCTDGLWSLVQDEELLSTVLNTPNPQVACDTLVDLANERGGIDNISVIVVRMPG